MENYDGHVDFGTDFCNQDFGNQDFEESGVDNFAEAEDNGNTAMLKMDSEQMQMMNTLQTMLFSTLSLASLVTHIVTITILACITSILLLVM